MIGVVTTTILRSSVAEQFGEASRHFQDLGSGLWALNIRILVVLSMVNSEGAGVGTMAITLRELNYPQRPK